MHATTERLEFAPPPTRGLVRAVGLAIVVHALLVVMLAIGVHWKRDATPVTVEAELWSALPVEAAPRPVPELPPPPPPEPVKPVPKAVVTPPAPTPPLPDPTIAIAKEKVRLQKEKQLQQERLEQEKLERDKLERDKHQKEALRQKKLLEDKAAHDKKLQQEQQKQQDAKSAADAKKLAVLRQQQIDRTLRMASQVVGSGSEDSRGKEPKKSGSAGYAERIIARVKPNITYTDTPTGNPTAEVEVRTSPDGTIISRKLVKPSGVKSWDDAVLNAIDKTEVLPRDVDGRIPQPMTLVFSPRG